MTTPFQPTLPPETSFTDPEISYIEDSPPGLWPENQDSNFGLVRRIFTDRVAELIGQQARIYKERFVASSVDFIDEWEREVGLPVNPAGSTLTTRRQMVQNRLAKGPFTKTRRREIVENFITATFGAPVEFGIDGAVLSSSGIPLFAETAPVQSLYSIRENGPYSRNLLANGNFEVNTTGWGVGGGAAISQSTAQAKIGNGSMLMAAPVSGFAQALTNAISGATSNRVFTFGVWVFASGTDIGKTVRVQLNEMGGASGETATTPGSVDYTLVAGWQFLTVTTVVTHNDRTALDAYIVAVGGVTGIYIDGAQVEEIVFGARGKNKLLNGSAERDLFWFYEAEFGGANVLMTRNNVGPLPMPHGAWNIQALVTVYGDVGIGIGMSTAGIQLRPDTTYTFSAYMAGPIGTSAYLRCVYPTPDESISATTVFDGSGNYVRLTGTFKTGADGLAVLRVMLSGTTAAAFFIDAVQLEKGSVATAYEEPMVSSAFVDTSKTPHYYEIRIANTVTPDIVGLTRELRRITPSGITFDVLQVANV